MPWTRERKYFAPLPIGCLNIHRTPVTANNSTNNNVEFFLVSDLKIVYYKTYQSSIKLPWTKEERIFLVTTYLETKSFKTVSKETQSINMIRIYSWDKKN